MFFELPAHPVARRYHEIESQIGMLRMDVAKYDQEQLSIQANRSYGEVVEISGRALDLNQKTLAANEQIRKLSEQLPCMWFAEYFGWDNHEVFRSKHPIGPKTELQEFAYNENILMGGVGFVRQTFTPSMYASPDGAPIMDTNNIHFNVGLDKWRPGTYLAYVPPKYTHPYKDVVIVMQQPYAWPRTSPDFLSSNHPEYTVTLLKGMLDGSAPLSRRDDVWWRGSSRCNTQGGIDDAVADGFIAHSHYLKYEPPRYMITNDGERYAKQYDSFYYFNNQSPRPRF